MKDLLKNLPPLVDTVTVKVANVTKYDDHQVEIREAELIPIFLSGEHGILNRILNIISSSSCSVSSRTDSQTGPHSGPSLLAGEYNEKFYGVFIKWQC